MKRMVLILMLAILAIFYAESAAAQSNVLFPCDGVTLGKTTVKELEELGTRTLQVNNETNQRLNYYIVRGQNVWFDEITGLAMSYHIVKTGALPEKWVSLGMSFENSYDQWLEFAQTHKLDVVINKKPEKRFYRGYDTFTAKLELLYMAEGVSYKIELDFNYSRGTETSDKNTLYSIKVRAL